MLALEDAGYFADVHSCEWWYGVSCACTVMSVLINSGLLCSLGRCRLFCRCPLLWMMACLVLCAGQSYEIKVKKLGDLSEYQGKCLRVSVNGNATVLDMFVSKVGHGCGQVVQGQGLRSPMLCAAWLNCVEGRVSFVVWCTLNTPRWQQFLVAPAVPASVSKQLWWMFRNVL